LRRCHPSGSAVNCTNPALRRVLGAVLLKYLTTNPQALGVLAWFSTAITVLGFAVVIWQIVRARRAADAAREAALGMAQRVRSRELLAQLANADNHLRVGQAHLGAGRRDVVSLCLELSRGSILEARQLSIDVAGDWMELQLLVIRLRQAEGQLAEMTEPLQNDPSFARLSLLLRGLSEGLQRNLARARYAYDIGERDDGSGK
jgi:hypothetical protein